MNLFCEAVRFSATSFCVRSGGSIHLPDHHVPAGQEHAVSLRDVQGAAAGEGERGVDDGDAAGDAGDPGQAAGAAEAAAGPGAEAAGAEPGDRRAERPPGRARAQAPRTHGQQRRRRHRRVPAPHGGPLHVQLLLCRRGVPHRVGERRPGRGLAQRTEGRGRLVAQTQQKERGAPTTIQTAAPQEMIAAGRWSSLIGFCLTPRLQLLSKRASCAPSHPHHDANTFLLSRM